MTAYIRNNEKKNRIFAKRERELLHAIKHDVSQEQLLLAAEFVRAAKISVFKCRFAMIGENQPHNFAPEEIAEHNKKLDEWLSISAEAIVERYRLGLPPP